MITQGQKYIFTPTGNTLVISNVTDKNVSWYFGGVHHTNKTKQVRAWTTLVKFKASIDKGVYKLINN